MPYWDLAHCSLEAALLCAAACAAGVEADFAFDAAAAAVAVVAGEAPGDPASFSDLHSAYVEVVDRLLVHWACRCDLALPLQVVVLAVPPVLPSLAVYLLLWLASAQ